MLPNLLIIGAAKCGTTSLHEYLDLHPEISMSAQKELNYFAMRLWRERGEWYRSRFTDPSPVRGESSPAYTMFPFIPSVPERIQEVIPEAKFIYLVRDPVERTLANYVELFGLHIEHRSAEVALADLEDPRNPHICPSRYATQLERYLRHFPSERILVIDREDLLHRRRRTLARVFGFLGVDPTFASPEFDRVHNPRTEKVRHRRLGLPLARRRRRARSGGLQAQLLGPLIRLLSQPIDATLSDSTREALIEALGPEVERLRELTGQRFDWPLFPAGASAAISSK